MLRHAAMSEKYLSEQIYSCETLDGNPLDPVHYLQAHGALQLALIVRQDHAYQLATLCSGRCSY